MDITESISLWGFWRDLMQIIPLFFICSVIHLFNKQIFPTNLAVFIKVTNLCLTLGVGLRHM